MPPLGIGQGHTPCAVRYSTTPGPARQLEQSAGLRYNIAQNAHGGKDVSPFLDALPCPSAGRLHLRGLHPSHPDAAFPAPRRRDRNQPRHHPLRVAPRRRAEDGGELYQTGQPGMVRRPYLLPGGAGLCHPGRKPQRPGLREHRLHHRGRDSAPSSGRRPGHGPNAAPTAASSTSPWPPPRIWMGPIPSSAIAAPLWT